MEDRKEKHEGEGGSSLLEVLIALAILLFLMIGVLSMFSMAYLQNLGSAARTDMTYKAQQVADAVRYLNFLQRSQSTGIPTAATTGLTLPLTGGTSVTITGLTGSSLTYPYWGPPSSTVPNAADILNPARMPYTITITVAAPNPAGLVTVTVAVVPNTATQNSSGPRYIGTAISSKEVDYVTQLPP